MKADYHAATGSVVVLRMHIGRVGAWGIFVTMGDDTTAAATVGRGLPHGGEDIADMMTDNYTNTV